MGSNISQVEVSVIIIYQESSAQVDACIASVEASCQLAGLSKDQYQVLCSNLPNKSVARNKLCKRAAGTILAFIDSDALATDFWVHELLKTFRDCARVAVVGGPNILHTWFQASREEMLADKLLTSTLATWKSAARYRVSGVERRVDESELTSCNLAIRKDVFSEVGGFPADCIPCEENVLLNKIEKKGHFLMYNPLAIVFHNRAPLVKPHLRKIFYYATGRGKMMRKGIGGMKMIPIPNVDYIILGVCLVLHYIAYISGLVWGYIKG